MPTGAGSKEYGPHLSCGTDLIVTEELARRVVEATPVILLPPLAYAYYRAFVDWPGSVSISAHHFTGVVVDTPLAHWGDRGRRNSCSSIETWYDEFNQLYCQLTTMG